MNELVETVEKQVPEQINGITKEGFDVFKYNLERKDGLELCVQKTDSLLLISRSLRRKLFIGVAAMDIHTAEARNLDFAVVPAD